MVALTWPISGLPAMRLQQALDRANRRVEPVGEFAIGCLQPTRASRFAVKRGCEPAAVRAQPLQLTPQSVFIAISVAAMLDRGIQCIEREREALHRMIEATLFRFRVHEFQKRMLPQTLSGRSLRAAK